MIYTRVHNETVAQNYYQAMAVIEERLQPHGQHVPSQNGTSNPNGNGVSAHLLSLVADLAMEPLTESQQSVVTELHEGLMALAESLNGKASCFDRVVNEQEVSPMLLVT